jgi:hypothetical protein
MLKVQHVLCTLLKGKVPPVHAMKAACLRGKGTFTLFLKRGTRW